MFRKILNRMFMLIGVVTISSNANAYASYEDFISDTGNEDVDKETQNNCRYLLDLESKDQLKANEEYVGKVIYDIVKQVADNPLEYCDEVQMAQVVEQEGGGNLR